MLTRNPEGQEELIIQLWQKAICKLYDIQCRIHNKCVTKKENFLQKVKTHYQMLEKIRNVTSRTLKIKTQWLRNSTCEIQLGFLQVQIECIYSAHHCKSPRFPDVSRIFLDVSSLTFPFLQMLML